MQIAGRMATARESGTARIARITGKLEASGKRVLKLNVGEPDFDTPGFIVEAAHRAMVAGQTRYTEITGTVELRAAVAEKFRRENNIDCTGDSVIVGTGAKQLIFNALMASVEPGDEVLIPTPSWVSYPDMTMIAGGRPVLVACAEVDGFKVDVTQLEAKISDSTRWIILNSPCNPTGSVYSREELGEIAGLLRHHPRVAVMCDDIYEKITFDGLRFATMAEVAPDIAGRVLTVNGVSKSHAMTGWRIGYATGPRQLITAMARLQSQSTTNPSSIGQAAALAALTETEQSDRFIAACKAAYLRRRDRLLQRISAIPGLRPIKPEGAFYSFVECRHLFGRTTPAGIRLQDDTGLCEYFLHAAGVSLVPGLEFSGGGYFRLSFSVADEVLDEAVDRLEESVRALI